MKKNHLIDYQKYKNYHDNFFIVFLISLIYQLNIKNYTYIKWIIILILNIFLD